MPRPLMLCLPLLLSAQDLVVERDVMVPMRDGVRLATDLYVPRSGGKFPAVMERTPYNKSRAGWASFYASRGYVCVIQDTRGRYGSEGVWHMMTDDVTDGYDTAMWIVKQPWSDGGFATLGTSYPGGTQHALALSDPPGLKAMAPVDAVANAGYFGMRNGGAFELRFFNWIFTIGGPAGSRAARDPGTRAVLEEAGKNMRQYLLNLPLRKGTTPIRLAPEYEYPILASRAGGPGRASAARCPVLGLGSFGILIFGPRMDASLFEAGVRSRDSVISGC